jgi:WD40 repeat protein
MRTWLFLIGWLLLGQAAPAAAQNAEIPPGDKNPQLRLEAGGPTSQVTALAFGADGRTLYVGGHDKVVHVWRLENNGEWQERAGFRIPLGPGSSGMINAIALSADGKWLAVAGLGMFRAQAGFRQQGRVYPALVLDAAMRQDRGAIYVFNTATGAAQIFRGHEGPVLSLAFAPPEDRADVPPPLLSAALHPGERPTTPTGAVWLWVVDKDTKKVSHRAWPNPLPDPGDWKRPGLAVWRTPGRAQDVQASFAWSDGRFRHWDVARGRDGATQLTDAPLNVTAVYVPGQNQLLTGASRSPNGYLRVWDLPGGREPERGALIPPDVSKQVRYLPKALAVFPSQPGGKPDRAAVVLQVAKEVPQGQGKKRIELHTRLHLLDLDPRRRGRLLATFQLWPWAQDESYPSLAVAPDGRYLAVAGHAGHEVQIYSVADLLKEAAPDKDGALDPAHIIRSTGSVMRYVAFAHGKDGLGLVLNERPRRKPGSPPPTLGAGDLVFDFAGPGLTEIKGWTVEAPKTEGWEANKLEFTKASKEYALEVRKEGRVVRRIALQPGQELKDFALLPPRASMKVPLLAVAWQESGEPKLVLYNVETGQPVRHFTGHEGAINSLAFSADGRLLASSAEDQTVCLWSLTDLDKLLGKHGLVPGLAIKNGEQGGAVVGRVEDNSPADGRLKPGDVLEAFITPAGKVQPLASARGFYDAVWDLTPGKNTVRLRVKGKGDVQLRVGQGIDERKPLLTLFVTRRFKGQDRDWAGWNPFGPYEVSTPDAERHLGWHINTGRPEAPTSFVRFNKAADYREMYNIKGILKALVRKGEIPDNRADDFDPSLRPKVTVLVGEVALDPAQADARGHIPVQTTQRMLHVTVHEFPRRYIRSVAWQLDGQDGDAWQPLERSADLEWSADLSRARWQRGVHRIRVAVRTTRGSRQEYVVERVVRYQPPPPTLTVARPAEVIKQQPFLLKADVQAAVPDQDVEVRIILNKKETLKKETLLPPQPARPNEQPLRLNIEHQLRLNSGENVIEIVAVNRGALKGYEENETARRIVRAVYNPKQPIIILEVLPLLEANQPDLERDNPPDQPIRVTGSRVRIVGSITATEKLLEAKRDGRDLRFKAGALRLEVNEQVTLRPGPQKIVFLARTENTQAKKIVDIDYQPQAPRPVLLPSPRGLVFYDDGKGPREITLEFQLESQAVPLEGEKLQAVALVNGRKLPQGSVKLDPATRKVTVRFTPKPGRNRVQVWVENAWKAVAKSELVDVSFYRPPRAITFVKPPQRSEKPVIRLDADVSSPLPLLPDTVRVTVNDRKAGPSVRVAKAGKDDTWRVRLEDVSLEDVRNKVSTIRLWVSNDDGECREYGECKVLFAGPPPERPDVRFLGPKEIGVTDPEVTVELRVQTETGLKWLRLFNNGTPSPQELNVTKLRGAQDLKMAIRLVPGGEGRPVDVAGLKPDADGFLRTDLRLPLTPGLNHVVAEAANDGGERPSSELIINYVRRPVRVVLDRLEPLDKKGPPIAAEVLPSGKLARPAPQARLWLYGRVVWDQDRDKDLQRAEWVRMRVNGVEQVERVPLQKPDPRRPRERAFRVEILLTRSKDNRMDIDVVDVPLDDANRPYLVDCARPEPEKRFLHLLVIAAGERDDGKLTGRLFQALRAKPVSPVEFTLQHFERGRLYGPLTGDVAPAKVYFQLCMMKQQIDLLTRKGPSTHIVVVYYHGGEAINAKGHFLRTSRPEVDPAAERYRVPCSGLEALLAKTLGANILLLDVRREGTEVKENDQVARWPRGSYVAVMRYARLQGGGDDAPLVQAWEEALKRVNRLKQVDDQVSREYQTLREKQRQALLYKGNIPPGLWDLLVGP